MVEISYLISELNPWKKGEYKLEPELIDRKILPSIIKWLKEDEIIVIKGARQTGKTTLIKQLIYHLITNEKIEGKYIFYFSFDDINIRQIIENSTLNLIKIIEEFLGLQLRETKQKIYLFIDEAQKINNFGEFIKILYEIKYNIKIIISGSSALQISSNVLESLRGRTISFTLYPFTFQEITNHSMKNLYNILIEVEKPLLKIFLGNFDEEDFRSCKFLYSNLTQFLIDIEKFQRKFLIFGSMPRIINSIDIELAKSRLNEYSEIFIKKDVLETLRISKYLELAKLMSLLSFQIGELMNYNELCNSVGISFETLKRFLKILEEGFLITLLQPYCGNKRNRIIKNPKIYYLDLGVRNSMAKELNYSILDNPSLFGHLIENAIFIILTIVNNYKNMGFDIYFWRTYQQQEIDFIIQYGKNIIPIEIKYKQEIRPGDLRTLKTFIESDKNINYGVVLSKNDFKIEKINNKFIIIIPTALFFGIV